MEYIAYTKIDFFLLQAWTRIASAGLILILYIMGHNTGCMLHAATRWMGEIDMLASHMHIT